ncbi:MAG TPA: 16S rRNA (adenine(1518)-N(6)/adenine(1519)-N(6))-dimethyltransferase RsmA [Candidatus Paceibacterota bacterium]
MQKENYKHKAKKSLGQNFLKSESALRKIIEVGEMRQNDVILEIGPGKGKLTERLLENSEHVIAIEKDNELFEFLKEKFSAQIKNGSLVLIHDNILNFNASAYGLAPSAYKIIANIPYNITGAILKKFLTADRQPERMVLLVQKEVAERIVARDGKESILSISVKAYGEPKMVMKVPARYFSPAPKVDSAVIAINNISRKNFTSPQPSPYKGEGGNINEQRFWEIVRLGFAHKRKTLSNNLKSLGFAGNPAFDSFAGERAEDLTLKQWITLCKIWYN